MSHPQVKPCDQALRAIKTMSLFTRENTSSFFDSIFSVEGFGSEFDLESVIGSQGMQTAVLVDEARRIAKRTREDKLREYKDRTIYVGVLLDALLKHAGKNVIVDSDITGERYTAGVIYATYQKGKKEEVCRVANAWFDCMILPMLTANFFSPSDEQTPPQELQTMEATIEPATRNRQERLREEACKRQNFRCALHSEEVDLNAPSELGDKGSVHAPVVMQVAHILPFSLNSFSLTSDKVHAAAVTWTMIERWTSISIRNLVGEGINDSSNAILFCPNAHVQFAKFLFFFDPNPDGQEHCYITKSNYPSIADIEVDFRSNTKISPPDPRYLSIHAAFAKVIRASAAAEYVEKHYRDQEERGILAPDGSTDISIALSQLNMISATTSLWRSEDALGSKAAVDMPTMK